MKLLEQYCAKKRLKGQRPYFQVLNSKKIR